MNPLELVLREILHRKLNFGLGLLTVTLAVLCFAGTMVSLRSYDLNTEKLVGQLESATKKKMNALADHIRRSMKGLGFNIYIFPEGQNLEEVYAQGYASKSMPESFVDTLAQSRIVTVNHLLPSLTRKIKWPEQGERTVILIGIRGEVPFLHKDPKKPLIKLVPPGKIIMGYELHHSLDLTAGETVMIKGKSFEITQCHEERGSVDDITIWMNLEECQEMLDMKGRINAIQALECNCDSIDRLAEVRKELSALLPGTRIIERQSKALARAEARAGTESVARQSIEETRRHRLELRRNRESFANLLAPLTLILGLTGVATLTFFNTRARLAEIGIFRALGVRSRQILILFVTRASCMGVLGAVLGLLALRVIAPLALRAGLADLNLGALLSPGEMLQLVIITPLLTSVAAWIPALMAAQKEPALILCHA